MKKYVALLLALCLSLTGCALVPPKTTMPTEAPATTEAPVAPTTEETTEPTTEPAPVYTNPLNGETLDAPYTGRVVAVTVSNIRDALPHYGTMGADILMEMWVNGSIIRDLALYTDITKAQEIGSVRSVRPMFNLLVKHYDAVLLDASGSDQALGHAKSLGVQRINVDTYDGTDYSYRKMDRDFTFKPASKLEHCLFVKPEGVEALLTEKGYATQQPEDKDYGLHFTENGTPAAGETAGTVTVTFTYRNNKKDTSMVYDESLGKYVYNQYDTPMVDGATGNPECFTNVIVMLADISMDGIYYTANFTNGGTGYFANGGKLIPITWTCDGEDAPFRFFTQDGQPLELGIGNTYIAVAPEGSPVSYE